MLEMNDCIPGSGWKPHKEHPLLVEQTRQWKPRESRYSTEMSLHYITRGNFL